jgi:outer membrane protein OmpA-like peptidoglycan-associated protein
MRIFVFASMLAALASGSFAEDGIVIRQYPGMPADGKFEGVKIVAQVKGQRFEEIRKDVESAVALLGNDRTWSNVGPDAAYLSAEITLGPNKYTLDSWYPLEHTDPKIAVSENLGLVPVSGPKEKKDYEDKNSDMYKQLVSIFDIAMKISTDHPHDNAPLGNINHQETGAAEVKINEGYVRSKACELEGDILYDEGAYTLNKDHIALLNKLAIILNKQKVYVKIIGYAIPNKDNPDKREYINLSNLELGMKRALLVAKCLVDAGVNETNIQIESMGAAGAVVCKYGRVEIYFGANPSKEYLRN